MTHLTLQSADVIHSFWLPQLNGKTDLIPSRQNETWLDPYETGVYFGNCAAYCGAQQANMLLRVRSCILRRDSSNGEHSKRRRLQRPKPRGEFKAPSLCRKFLCELPQGERQRCGGPFQAIGAGAAPLNKDALRAWVRDPQDLKSGCLMPDMQLHDKEVDAGRLPEDVEIRRGSQ